MIGLFIQKQLVAMLRDNDTPLEWIHYAAYCSYRHLIEIHKRSHALGRRSTRRFERTITCLQFHEMFQTFFFCFSVVGNIDWHLSLQLLSKRFSDRLTKTCEPLEHVPEATEFWLNFYRGFPLRGITFQEGRILWGVKWWPAHEKCFHFEFFVKNPTPVKRRGARQRRGVRRGKKMINTTGGTENCRTGTEIRPEFLYTFFFFFTFERFGEKTAGRKPRLATWRRIRWSLAPLAHLDKDFLQTGNCDSLKHNISILTTVRITRVLRRCRFARCAGHFSSEKNVKIGKIARNGDEILITLVTANLKSP
jgi:hypothetical protein